MLPNFANNLLSIVADVYVFKPLGTWLDLLSFLMLKIIEMAQMWPNTLEKLFLTPTLLNLPISCDLNDLSQIFSFPLEKMFPIIVHYAVKDDITQISNGEGVSLYWGVGVGRMRKNATDS